MISTKTVRYPVIMTSVSYSHCLIAQMLMFNVFWILVRLLEDILCSR